MREHVVYLAYRLGWAVVRRLPEPAAYRAFRLVADLASARGGASVRHLEANLRRVVGDLDDAAMRDLVRRAMRSYLRYWCDVFRLPDWDTEMLSRRIEVAGEHWLRAPGFVGALAHMGNWDHAGAWSCATGTPVTTVVERLRPERLFEQFVAFREGVGMEVLPLTGGDRDVLRALAAAVRADRAVCLLADRDLSARGVDVTFFGEPARMPGGPALLALTTGARLHPVTSTYEGDVMRLEMHEPVAVPASGTTREKVTAMMQEVASVFEQAIRARPEDWHMLQPLWTADVERARADAAVVPA